MSDALRLQNNLKLSQSATRTRDDVLGRPWSHGRIYLAVPYLHDREEVTQARVTAVDDVAGTLLMDRKEVFSPISMGHPIHQLHKGDMPTSHEFWMAVDREHYDTCACVCVLDLPGVELSKGVGMEMGWALDDKKPLFRLPWQDWLRPGIRSRIEHHLLSWED